MAHLAVHGALNEALVLFLERPLVGVQVLVHVKVDSVVVQERTLTILVVVLVEDIQVVQPHIMALILKAEAADLSIADQTK
jgi:hypothetical protein